MLALTRSGAARETLGFLAAIVVYRLACGKEERTGAVTQSRPAWGMPPATSLGFASLNGRLAAHPGAASALAVDARLSKRERDGNPASRKATRSFSTGRISRKIFSSASMVLVGRS